MLIWGGLILDRFGIRFTGKLATILMVVGTAIEYYAMTQMTDATQIVMGYKWNVLVASAGYSLFGVGAEVAVLRLPRLLRSGSRARRWQRQWACRLLWHVSVLRLPMLWRFRLPVLHEITTPIPDRSCLSGRRTRLLSSLSLVLDKKLDRQLETAVDASPEDKFSFKDVKHIVCNPGFWLIAVLCVLFYSCVFPFQKFASELMITKYQIDENLAGTIAGLPGIGKPCS